MFRIGITGGIGSGKSYVAHLLHSEMGIPVYDCDAEAKRLNDEDPAIRRALVQLIGSDVYSEGRLVKPVLASYLFASEENAERVNSIIHPVVKTDFMRWAQLQRQQLVAMESAILYESGFHSMMDSVLYVDAPMEVRIERAMKRDGSTREQVEARMRMQQQELAQTQARYTIHNDGKDDRELLAQLESIIEDIKSKLQ